MRGLVEVFVLLHNCVFVRYSEQLCTDCVRCCKMRGRVVEILSVSVCACVRSFVRSFVCVSARAQLADCPKEGEVIGVIIPRHDGNVEDV
jgi:hypothetical protein